jgi:hypothetical protein
MARNSRGLEAGEQTHHITTTNGCRVNGIWADALEAGKTQSCFLNEASSIRLKRHRENGLSARFDFGYKETAHLEMSAVLT